MKKINYLPVILAVAFLAAAFGTWNVSFGQNGSDEVIIELDDEILPAETEEPAARPQTQPEPSPSSAAPANPDSIDATAVEQRLTRIEAQTKELLVNQKKIDDAIISIAEDIRQARIFASRGGGGVLEE